MEKIPRVITRKIKQAKEPYVIDNQIEMTSNHYRDKKIELR